MELAINGKLTIFESLEKQTMELAFILSHKKTIKPISNGSVLQKTQNFTISFKTTKFEKLTKPQAQTNFTHSKSFEHQPLCFASKEKIQRKPQQYFYDTIRRLSS